MHFELFTPDSIGREVAHVRANGPEPVLYIDKETIETHASMSGFDILRIEIIHPSGQIAKFDLRIKMNNRDQPEICLTATQKSKEKIVKAVAHWKD